jgi:prepilin-type N-terminal cleavage/methylation domain-containing protein
VRKRIRFGKRGFTLLELMIAIALMLIVMLMLRTMFVTAQDMYVRAARRVEVYQQARSALDLIEQDLMRLRDTGVDTNDVLALRSLRPETYDNPEAVRGHRMYSQMNDWAGAEVNETLKIRDLIAFTGTATWYDADKKQYITGDATIVYYLRRRLPYQNEPTEGAYLVRRVLPVRSMAELSRIGRGEAPLYDIKPSEEEIANFVYSARVFADDQAAFQLGVRNGAFNYDTMPECARDVKNSDWMWVKTALAGTPSGPPPRPGQGPTLILPTPPAEDRVEFGGVWRTHTAPDRDFVSARWNMPAVVVIDLMMIDRSFERYDANGGSGTYRSFSRAIHMPSSEPMKRLDNRDLALLNR